MKKIHCMDFLGEVSAQTKYYMRSKLEELGVISGKQSPYVHINIALFGVNWCWGQVMAYIKN